MFLSFLIGLGKKGNSNLSVLTVGTVGVIGVTGAGIAVTQYIRRSMNQSVSLEEEKKAELASEILRTKFTYDSSNLREWKVIDCGSGKKCIVPEGQNAFNPGTSLTDLTGKITIAASAPGNQTIVVKVPVPNNMNENQVDTFFSNPASAPPPVIYNGTGYGLNNSQITFSIDSVREPNNGQPGELILQAFTTKPDGTTTPGALASVELGVPPPPTCSVTANRNGNSANCSITVTTTGLISGDPSITGINLNRTGTNWTNSNASCPQNTNTTFSAFVSGLGGTGSCVSNPIGPVPAPTCSIAVNRTSPSATTCNINVATTGVVTAVSVSNPSVSSLSQSGSNWSASNVACSLASFTPVGTVSGPGSPTPVSCSTTATSAVDPTCSSFTASRNGTSNTCTVVLTPGGGFQSATITSSGIARQGTGTVTWSDAPCSQTASTNFNGSVLGLDPSKTASCPQQTIQRIPEPSCTISAARNSDLSSCRINITALGQLNSPPDNPNLFISENGMNYSPIGFSNAMWSGSTFTGITSCNGYQNLTFGAQVRGPGGTSLRCTSNPVSNVPAPTCSLQVSRNAANKAQCDIQITGLSGTITSASVSPSASLTRNGNLWTGQYPCSTTEAYTFTSSVTGPGSATSVSCGTQTVPYLNCYSDASGGNLVDVYSVNGKNFRYHKFTTVGNSTLTVNKNCSPFDYLIVAGGGGGGRGRAAGGGGAGGLIYSTGIRLNSLGSYSVTVGDGGGAEAKGANSLFNSQTAIGGGAGAYGEGGHHHGGAGGSGGGAGFKNNCSVGGGTAGQGHNGGCSRGGNWIAGGGGGGAGGAGGAGTGPGAPGNATGGTGGAGRTISITGAAICYAGGGGGRGEHSPGSAHTWCGGGLGGKDGTGGGSGVDGYGGGGGGGSGGGGSGLVIVAYEINLCTAGEAMEKPCPITNGTGKLIKTCGASGLWGTWGACQVDSCNSGFSQAGNQCTRWTCTPNSTQSAACTPMPANASSASKYRTCASNGLSWGAYGPCQISSCASGFTLVNNACTCTAGGKDYTTAGCTGGKRKARTCNAAGTAYGPWSACLVQ